MACGGLVGSVPVLMSLWDYGVRPLRTANPSGIFSNFYDLQARALMDGNLDVPIGTLSIEAFRVGGRDYMYFPPGPALLRMPLFALTDKLDGRLSALSMLLAWMALATFVGLLLWRVRCVLRPVVPLGWLEPLTYGALTTVIVGGSIVTYIAALPWVYHEAYMWATSMAIGAIWAIIGVLEHPSARRMLAAGACALGAVLSRTTAGWAICLTLLAVGATFLVSPSRRPERRYAIGAIVAGTAPLLVGITLNWAKFRHPFMFPLEDQVWTAVNAHRRRALLENGGTLAGPQFFPTSLVAYFRPDGIRFTRIFPYLTLPARPVEAVGGAFVDQSYRTGSATAFMPLLCVLGGWGLVRTFRRRAGAQMVLLRIPVVGAIAITGGVMFYGYIAPRYVAEFLPALALLSAIGLVELVTAASSWTVSSRRVAVSAFAGLGAFGLFANAAIAISVARENTRGAALQQYLAVRVALSDWTGTPNDDYVEFATSLDGPAPADQMRVIGDCEAVYLASGDRYEPWIAVDVRGVNIEVTIVGDGAPGRLTLVVFDGAGRRSIDLDHDGVGNYRLVVEGGRAEDRGDWYSFERGTTFGLTVTADHERSVYRIDAPAILNAEVPMSDWNEDWLGVPSQVRIVTSSPRLQAARGIVIDASWDEPSAFCDGLRRPAP